MGLVDAAYQVSQRCLALTGDILQASQKASSRLKLVLWPDRTTERLATDRLMVAFQPLVARLYSGQPMRG
jgi:hypothetical protein